MVEKTMLCVWAFISVVWFAVVFWQSAKGPFGNGWPPDIGLIIIEMPSDRELFEAWCARDPRRFPIAELKNGVYPDLRTQCAWEGWQR